MKSKFKVTLIILSTIAASFLLTLSGCSLKPINRTKDIVYMKPENVLKQGEQRLNIFAPKKHKEPKDVIIFIHGGNWNSGRKEQYNIIGANWAKKDIVYVIIDYPLSPVADYKEMTIASAKSVKWVRENIAQYGGNPERIFISGHSAGGHLAALIAIDDKYFEDPGIKNPVKGIILVDAAGLDMYGYLQEEKFPKENTYMKTFTTDPKIWKEATPFYQLHKNMPPMILFRGGKTYPSILKSNEKFVQALADFAPGTPYHVQKSKKHVPMITQFFFPWNKRYGQIKAFMKTVK